MKKFFLTTVAILTISLCNAQVVKYGIKMGSCISSFSGLDGGSSKIGYNIGGFAEIALSEKLVFQPELLYATVGALSENTIGSYVFTSKDKLNYINIPLILKYKVAEKFGLEFGPHVGFLLSGEFISSQSSSLIGGTTYTAYTTSSTDMVGVNNLSYGLNLGAGYDLTKNVNLDLRYSLGMSKIQKDVPAGANALKNNVIWINLAYKF
jgi:hypothetical protein